MHIFRDNTFLSSDGKTPIRFRVCVPDGEIRGIVQIAHGIAEHVERYDAFAAFLADHGFLVAANDHLGHGKSISNNDSLGFFAEQHGWMHAVKDMRQLYERMHAEYPALPYFLFGHSMGSFLTRTYLIDYPDGLTGAVICGTGQQAGALVKSGLLLGKIEALLHGPKYRSPLLDQLAFGAYNKGFAPPRTRYDWLTRDNALVDAYIADPRCGFMPTASLFSDMMGGISYISKPANLARMNKTLPVFFISGDKDPVGENGKGVKKAFALFQKAGMRDATLKLYPNCRHEILNEIGKETVMEDVLNWLDSKI